MEHSVTTLDLTFVRSQFPAFSQPGLKDQSFFENAGGSYACAPVIDRLARFYRERKVQPYAPYTAAQAGGAEMDEARTRLAALMGVQRHELSFGPSTTANTYVLAQAVRRWLKPGEAIVVTNQDHEANSGPWRRLAEDGVEVREWQIDPVTGHLDPARLKPLLADGRVRLVCFPHCSNVVAEINPVAEIVALAHAAGAATCVDGVSYAPHGLPNVAELGADIYLFSAYKVYGPHQGIMVIREDLGFRLPNQGHYFNGETLYKRFTPAGPDHAQIAASAGMADYFDAFHAHQRTDKGFGAAAGPDAPAVLARAFRAFGYAVSEGDSPWLLGPADQRLVSELASGFADAAGELGAEARATAWDWRSQPRVGAIVGHTDTLALPAVK